jgi:hypothetical protein
MAEERNWVVLDMSVRLPHSSMHIVQQHAHSIPLYRRCGKHVIGPLLALPSSLNSLQSMTLVCGSVDTAIRAWTARLREREENPVVDTISYMLCIILSEEQ